MICIFSSDISNILSQSFRSRLGVCRHVVCTMAHLFPEVVEGGFLASIGDKVGAV